VTVDPSLAAGIVTAAVGGIWAFVTSRNRNKVDLVTIAQDAASKVIESLNDEIERLQHRATALEAQDERCRRDLADLRERMGAAPSSAPSRIG
jgi:predicted  nucleic acid-binding Zn-ribbon protein